MTIVNIHEAKTHLSRLIKKVLNGEEVVIARGNKPVAKLVQYDHIRKKRQIGTAKGKVRMAKDFKAVAEDFREYMERNISWILKAYSGWLRMIHV